MSVLWVAPVAALAFVVIGKLVGNRASVEDEILGLDIPEMGVVGYAADMAPQHGTARTVGAAPVGEPSLARERA